MLLDLRQVFETNGYQKTFEFVLDTKELIEDEQILSCSPITVKGTLYNRSMIVWITYDIKGELTLKCDRCLSEYSHEVDISIKAILLNGSGKGDEVEELSDYDSYIDTDGLVIDLSRLSLDDILLSLPTKLVCNEDCKGFCARCFVNLNYQDCRCKPDIDPRLSVLSQLLDD